MQNINRKSQDIGNAISTNAGNRPVDNFVKTIDGVMTDERYEPGGVVIKNATKQGYLIAHEGDGIDISSRIDTHRGTVQKGMSQTVKTTCDIGVLEIEK